LAGKPAALTDWVIDQVDPARKQSPLGLSKRGNVGLGAHRAGQFSHAANLQNLAHSQGQTIIRTVQM
jgi:hypothetical protein